MAILKQSDLAAPLVPRETVKVDELKPGAEVVVRGLLLSERLTLMSMDSDYSHVARALHLTVLAENDEPLWSVPAWDSWGARNMRAAIRLYDVVKRLSGFDEDVNEKNSERDPSSSS